MLLVALTLAPMLAGAQTVITERNISLNAAMELATASLEKCRADGYKVTITVLNRHARAAVVLSDDGVNPHTIENSMRKAYTAFTTRSPSVEMGKRAQPGLSGFLLLDRITTIEGDCRSSPARNWSARSASPARRAARRTQLARRLASTRREGARRVTEAATSGSQ
jgi:hypothetical protein